MEAKPKDDKPKGVVNIRGKEYETVALRVHKFREAHPGLTLLTEVLYRDTECVVMKATILDEKGRVIATGHAEEYRKASEINRTSALENCETSAIGRALACFGLGGTEFASADEVARAINGQKGEPKKESEEKAYKEYEALYLPMLRDAALHGLQALQKAFVGMPPERGLKDAFWTVHSKPLKDAAMISDKQR